MLIYLILMFVIYFGFLLACIAGWRKFVSQSNSHGATGNELVSVVLAVRNEENAIAPLLASLRYQDFRHNKFEVILVNDHSTDRSEQIILSWIKENPHMQCKHIHSTGQGKKEALAQGIRQAKGEIILTTDADCVIPTDWITGMVFSFNLETTMVIGLVKIQQHQSVFSKLQALEFSSLPGSGMALHALGFPVMCNGASLAFRKSSFEAVNGYEGNIHIPSGDDEFLMRKLEKKFPGSIQSIRRPSVVVTTQPQPSLRDFFHQRLRWAGKWKVNDSIVVKALAMFIFVFQLTSLIVFGLLFTGKLLLVVSMLLGLKFLIEGYFLFHVSKRLHQGFSIPVFLLLQVVYPFYVVTMGIFSQLLDYEWKGRSSNV